MGASLLALAKSIYYHCIAASYINTTVSFKSSITKIYYCWNPLISEQNVNSFGQGTCTFDCQSGNLKKLCLWQPCLNKLMHVDRELKY